MLKGEGGTGVLARAHEQPKCSNRKPETRAGEDARASIDPSPATARSSLWDRERHIHYARSRFGVLPPTSGDHHKLATIDRISDGRSVSGKWKSRLPQQGPRCLIQGPELLIKVGRPD